MKYIFLFPVQKKTQDNIIIKLKHCKYFQGHIIVYVIIVFIIRRQEDTTYIILIYHYIVCFIMLNKCSYKIKKKTC